MGLGSSLFARHYSGSRGFFPFLWVLRCFSSPACHCPAYVFSWEHARITTRRFPHSEIPGSVIGQHLPRAYRSRPRPSSALGAKASTVCSCSLDQKEHVCCHYGVFKVHAGSAPALQREEPHQRHGLSKLNSARGSLTSDCLPETRDVEVDVISRRTGSSDEVLERTTSTSPAPTGVRAPVSLERR
jgi:hypothetical protein